MGQVNFLDLEIEIIDKQFKFQTYFKPTDRNGFIPTDSCHHQSWLCSTQRFLDKGYASSDIDLELQNTLKFDRRSLIAAKPQRDPNNNFKFAMLTSFFNTAQTNQNNHD